MISLLLAAGLAGQLPPPRIELPPAPPLIGRTQTHPTPKVWTFTAPPSPEVVRLPRMERCAESALMQTSVDEALLFRPEDRAATQFKKLADLPPAKACLAAERGK